MAIVIIYDTDRGMGMDAAEAELTMTALIEESRQSAYRPACYITASYSLIRTARRCVAAQVVAAQDVIVLDEDRQQYSIWDDGSLSHFHHDWPGDGDLD